MCQLVEDSILTSLHDIQLLESNGEIQEMDILSGLQVQIEKANTQGLNIKIRESMEDEREGKVRVVIHLKLNQCFYDLVIEIQIGIRNKKLHCRASFLQGEHYVVTESSQRRRMVCRKLLKINNQIQGSGLKFIQSFETGKLMILSINDQSSMFISKQVLWQKMKSLIKSLWQLSVKYSSQLFQIINKEAYKQHLLRSSGSEELKRIKKQQQSYTKLCKQLEVSHVNFGLSCREDEASFPTLQKSTNHLQKLKEFIFNSTQDTFENSSRRLFCTNFEEFLEVPYHLINYQIQHNQSKLYSSYLKTPVPRDPHPGENKFIFNQISITKPESVKFQQTQLQGGTSKIIVSKLSFYYCASTNSSVKYTQKKPSIKQKQVNPFNYPKLYQPYETSEEKRGYGSGPMTAMLTKMVGTKVPKKRGKQGWDDKYENEKNIVRLMKSGVSAYVLKYYISKQVDFTYKNCLLMDFVPSAQPLSNYIQIYHNTLSLNSKSFLLVNIVNSLRFLNDYHIVHMDLGLNNVLVYRDYLIKLIDFGQAYSKSVKTSDGECFKRGYTFPFCAPEYFQRKNEFTIRQDVFSFAVIAWRVIFNDYMFFPTDKTLQAYKSKTYLKKIFLAPERGQAFANEQTINFIYRLLFKCLDPDENLRCEPSWLTIFFKIIYFHLL